MNAALELHDSTVASVERESGVLRISLATAYIHRSAGRPGVDAGQGYVQPAELLFSQARVDIHGACIGDLSSGAVSRDGRVFENVIPLPIHLAGVIQGRFEFTSGGMIEIWALAFACLFRVRLVMSRNMMDSMSIYTNQQQQTAASPKGLVARSSSREHVL